MRNHLLPFTYLCPGTPQFVACCSRAQSCPALCDPRNCSTPGFPVRHQLPDLAKLMSVESLMPPNRLTLCRPLLPLPSVFPSIRVFASELALPIRWSKDWSFSITCLVTVKAIESVRQYEYMLFFLQDFFMWAIFFKLYILYWGMAYSQCCAK